MEGISNLRSSARSSLSTSDEEKGRFLAEVIMQGYCVMTHRSPNSSRIMVVTFGLGYFDHPEFSILTNDENEDEACGLLQYLAEQVLYEGKEFAQGAYSTTFYPEIIFTEEDFDMNHAEFDDDFSPAFPYWLRCSLPTSQSAEKRSARGATPCATSATE